jgi:hypothetical protein
VLRFATASHSHARLAYTMPIKMSSVCCDVPTEITHKCAGLLIAVEVHHCRGPIHRGGGCPSSWMFGERGSED